MNTFDILWFVFSLGFIVGLYCLERWWAGRH